MRAMTTATVVLCPDLPASGLDQSMHNPTIPLSMHDIFDSPGVSGDITGIQISTRLISDAIRRVHRSGVKKLFTGCDRYPQMPSIQMLKTSKTEYRQLGAIYEDEGTIEGTYGVHKSIFLDQLGLQAPEKPNSEEYDDFRNRLWLVHGDQLTTHHIRSVKKEQARAQRPFDRRNWLLGIPAWFHIQMNLLNTIVRTHWAPDIKGDEAHHCLSFDIALWGRSTSSRENVKYHQIQPLLTQSFTSRVLTLFYTALQSRGYFAKFDLSSGKRDEITDIISSLTPDQFLELVEDIRLTAFTLDAWNGDRSDKQPHNDIEFRTMCRMLQEIELFLTVRHAVQHADIGMLRRLVDPLIIYFFGASQHNYGREMLYYRWLLSPVNTPELQHAILASGIINWQGKATTHKPIDLGQEHLNLSVATSIRSYKNSTHDIDIIFDRLCLVNTWVGALRTVLEETFGEHMPGAHTTANVNEDIFLLARRLFISELAAPRILEQSTHSHSRPFDSYDIMSRGMEVIEKQVTLFNEQQVIRQGTVAKPLTSPTLHTFDIDFIDHDDYLDDIDTIADLEVGL
jgi:hypothetical protein